MILFIFALLLGMVNGILSGLFGLGGGILVVPIISTYISLIGLPEHSMSIAVATSLCSIIVTLSLSAFQHYKAGNLPIKFAVSLIIPSILGTIFGSLLTVSSDLARLIFGGFLIFAGIQMYLGAKKSIKIQNNQDFKNAEHIKHNENIQTHSSINKTQNLQKNGKNFLISIVTVFGLSVLSSIIGVGGGSLLTPILLAIGWHMRATIATSAFLGLVIGVSATITKIMTLLPIQITQSFQITHDFWLLGHVHIIWWLGLVIGAVFTSKIGVSLSNKLPVFQLKRYFSFLLLIISMYMIYKGFHGLNIAV
jgi:uncharacterized membrane protein YfcA